MQCQDIDVAVLGFANAEDDVAGDRFAICQFLEAAVEWQRLAIFIREVGEVRIANGDDTQIDGCFVAWTITHQMQHADSVHFFGDRTPSSARRTDAHGATIGAFLICVWKQRSHGSARQRVAFDGQVVRIQRIAAHRLGVEGLSVWRDVPVDRVGFFQSQASCCGRRLAVNRLP